jgi:hypothetical protein
MPEFIGVTRRRMPMRNLTMLLFIYLRYWGLKQGLAQARQVLYLLNPTPRPFVLYFSFEMGVS